MKCSDKEWQHCRVEKMGCEGCYYNESNTCDGSNTNVGSIDKAICELKNYLSKRKIKYTKLDRHDKAIETVLKDREKWKRLAEMNLKDSEEFKNNMCEHRCLLKSELDNSISKDKIRAKIEEYKKLLQSCNKFRDLDRIKSINERILSYKELLEEQEEPPKRYINIKK